MDIDNTMLHCLSYEEAKKANRLDIKLNQIIAQNAFSEQYKRDYLKYYRFLAKQEGCNLVSTDKEQRIQYVLVFRPGIFKFLIQLNNVATFRISTTGTREYVNSVLQIMDPDRKIFTAITSRDEQKTYKEPLYIKYVNFGDKNDMEYMKHFEGISDSVLERTVIIDDNTLVWSSAGKFNQHVLKSLVFIQGKNDAERFWINQAMTFLPENNLQVIDKAYGRISKLYFGQLYYLQLESFQIVINKLANSQSPCISNELTKIRKSVFENCVFVSYYDQSLLQFYEILSLEFGFQFITYAQYQELHKSQQEQKESQESQEDDQQINLLTQKKFIFYLIPSKASVQSNDYIVRKLSDFNENIGFQYLQSIIQQFNNDQKYRYYIFNQEYQECSDVNIIKARQLYNRLNLKIVNLEYLLISLYMLRKQDDFYWFINFGAQFVQA